jgi:hypothetical protein
MKILVHLSSILTCISLTFSFSFQEACSKMASKNKPVNESQVNSIPSTQDIRTWISPEVLGLKLGRSTLADVKKKFGKPIWEGSNQEKVFTDESDDEILVQYRNVAGIDAQFGRVNIDFIIGKKTKVVKWVTLYTEAQLNKKDILSRFGNDYFEIESWGSTCIEKSRKPGSSGKKMNSPFALVYPNKGMYISIRDDNYVDSVQFAMRCVGAQDEEF